MREAVGIANPTPERRHNWENLETQATTPVALFHVATPRRSAVSNARTDAGRVCLLTNNENSSSSSRSIGVFGSKYETL